MNCHYDTDRKAYLLPDNEPCTHDEFGLPSRHCTARKTCSQHIGWDELTCARCLSRFRQSIRRIAEVAPLMMTAALENGSVDSEAVMLAGPACDVEAWSWRKVAAMQGRAWHMSEVEDDDEYRHPYTVLTRWARMLSEDYGLTEPEQWTITNAAELLERLAHRVANDEQQDFRLISIEIRQCRNHMDSELRVTPFQQKGVPCRICVEEGKVEPTKVRLRREYAHWCEDETCERVHLATDELDIWRCPRNKDHWWTHADYTNRLEERRSA